MKSFESLKDKVLWFTGASGGLGRSIIRKLATETGARFALSYQYNSESAKELANDLTRSGIRTTLLRGDLAKPGVAHDMVNTISQVLGPLYGVVHLAGPYLRKPVIEHSREEFDLMINGNLSSYFEVVRASVPIMREHQCGRIVGTAMVGAQQTIPMLETGPHLAAKSGVVALTKTLALEEARNGITANVIAPGHIPNKSISRSEARSKLASDDHPMGVHGSYEDISDAIQFLLAPETSYVTGTVLDVTGGWTNCQTHYPES